MLSFKNMFSLMFTLNMCCYKNRIKVAIYKLNGLRISDEFACKLCIGLFIMNLIGTDIILRGQLVPLLLYIFFGSFISTTGIVCISVGVNTYLVLSLYGELKCLIKTVNCKCIEYVDAGDYVEATRAEPVREHVD
jgi:hypothetical protein